MDGIKRANSYVYSFSSVAGEKDVNAALCILPEIAIGGFRIKDFPFYLIDDLNKQQALLGNDFLTSCDVIQVKEECLSAYNFDKTQMMTKMMSTHAFHLLTLSSL